MKKISAFLSENIVLFCLTIFLKKGLSRQKRFVITDIMQRKKWKLARNSSKGEVLNIALYAFPKAHSGLLKAKCYNLGQ